MTMTGHDVLVLSPSFGQWSPAPRARMDALGLTARATIARSPLTSAQLQAEIGTAEALIVGLDEVDAAAIAAGEHLKVIAKHGVGVDNIDVAAAKAHGITVVNVPGANHAAVADLVFGLLLGLARHIVEAHRSVVAGEWAKFHGPELSGKQLGIVGLGRIGCEVARRARGFGMTLLAYDPYAPAERFEAEGAARADDLDALFASSDMVTLHLPSSGTTLVDERRLALMRPGALLINAARGDLVDEDAVAAALASGRLGGYAADAFASEPPVGSPLLAASNVLLTPHIGAFTDRANELMGVSVVEDIAAVLDGRSPRNPV
ncbi:MAG: phosphoglycerate dehydrogenase [Propioniciclava sp.]|uniref:phosphoglycerate dehydrogenase n=1 Tax=Propioniciclava sp. TaxID=2038686 RepID=UPI0039E6235A